jgi:hypothetical protein
MPGSTPIYGFPYPDPSDLVANYPALGQQLAEDVETAIAASGKVLQIVRDTDSTSRTTSSTSYVDITGMSVTITPTKNTSAILLIMTAYTELSGANNERRADIQIADASNNGISGASGMRIGISGVTITASNDAPVLIGYATPATISAVTYKIRAKVTNASNTINFANDACLGQLYAIEVAP